MENSLADYYFHQGTNFHAYKHLGCNLKKHSRIYEYSFRVFAKNAHSVMLLSDFSGWDTPLNMKRITEGGIWETIITSKRSLEGSNYKFKIVSEKGEVLKGDPYARHSLGGEDGASVVCCEASFKWGDSAWCEYRIKAYSGDLSLPINIYEVHLGSFLRNAGKHLSYENLADTLAAYLKSMSYTHVELLPIQEYPYDGSWGYQPCAFYAPTSRFGTPDGFRYFVNKMHECGIGVILDWVGAHFPKDEWGLFEFDGSPLYEYQGWDRMESDGWGTRFFDLGREEIQSFLISNALYYLREFHIDALRVDAVASMIYLDYERAPGEWIRNVYGTNENLEAVAFLKKLCGAVKSEFPDVLMIAEESGSRGGITAPISKGGLGFDLKWNMGFANDLFDYLKENPIYRKHKHRALNFPIMYAYSEKYCLPISHDEVVHGKHSFIDKVFGDTDTKFSGARAALLFIMTFPGKKLTFMGTEFAQFREWDYDSELEWFMLDFQKHSNFREYVKALNELYLVTPPLWEMDFEPSGFSWILADEADKNTVVFERHSRDGSSVTVAISFSGAKIQVEIPDAPNGYSVIFESSEASGEIKLKKSEASYILTLPPHSGAVLKKNEEFIKYELKGEKEDVL